MQQLGRLANIWRYPVKSLAAEPLTETEVTPEGLPGDRTRALIVESGHARDGKAYRGKEHNLLHTTHDAQRAVQLAGSRSVNVTVTDGKGARFFDDAPISLIFDRWIDEVAQALEMPLDPLRWRENFYAAAAPDFDFLEQDLADALIQIGPVLLRVREPIGRCVTTTYDIQTGEPDNDVLLYVAQKRGNRMGVYCEVEAAGTVRVGDDLRLRAR